MRMLRTQSGPFVERPYYEDSDIESIAIDELSKVHLLPATPQPIRVDRFIEKRYGIVPQYEGRAGRHTWFDEVRPEGSGGNSSLQVAFRGRYKSR